MHRSGTSMITRGLHDAGLHLLGPGAERFIDAADDNPEGFWENAAIVACNDDLLEAAGGAWDNPPALLPQGADDPRVAHVNEAATRALDGLRAHRPWGFKDPRVCLTAAYWLDLEPELHFVVCVRHPLEVALSLKRRNQNSYSLGLALWERYYTSVLELVPPERRIVSHYDSFFTDPEGELRRLCEFAGLEPVAPHVRADLRHHTIDVSLADADVSPALRALYADLCREAGVALAPEPPSDEGRVRRLVLDGAVAERHAAQRQQAIDRLEERLEERETQLRREKSVTEANLRARVRELEVDLGEAVRGISELEQLTRRTAARVEVIVETVTLVRVRRKLGSLKARAAKRVRSRAVQPARKLASRGKRRVVPRARAVVKRAPEPAQDVLRRGRRVVARARGRALPAPPRVTRRPQTDWKPEYERLVAASVPDGEAWLVLAPGSPRAARRARSRPAAPFPEATAATGADLAFVAELEGLRFQGYRRLAVPAPARQWFNEHVALRDHVAGRYRVLGDDAGGVVFDLTTRAESGPRSLRAEVAQLVASSTSPPAILDWTEVDISRELEGMTTFVPPDGDTLPYLDASVEIVVVNGSHDVREARRVASGYVITVESGTSGPLSVRTVEPIGDARPAQPARPRTLVWTSDPSRDERWRTLLADVVADAGAAVRFGDVDSDGIDFPDHDIVVIVEPYVLPLPGSLEAAAAFVAGDPTAAVAGKVVRRDGRLEAAGGTVFSDRSVALVGNGSDDVNGPWHEYVRPVCWAPGVVAASTALWTKVTAPAYVAGRAFVREWCSEVWASGGRVVYHPSVQAVRLVRDAGEASIPLQESAWQRVLDLRPRRPASLHDGEWRYLIAHDDVEACRG
jgi:hypothetical protein